MSYCINFYFFFLHKNSRILPGDEKGEHFLSANNIKIFKLEEANFGLDTLLLTSKLGFTLASIVNI